ncbi:MAG: hypothetical protein RIT27_231 [Pseudomonadota bacterium]|jgi:hypothetical protein
MKKLLFTLLIFALIGINQANAFLPSGTIGKTMLSPFIKSSKALLEEEIIRLSKLTNEVGGTEKVGKELGRLNLPNEVLEDAFMRIAIYQNKITRKESEEMFFRLSQTEGFRTTLRKIIGNSDIVTAGHLNELRIANAASSNGFKVISIGAKFDDPAKKALTDIDLILQKGNKTFIVEAKHYAETTKIPLDRYRADLDTLITYKGKDSNIIPIFTITNKPTDLQYLKSLQYEADKKSVQLIFGEVEESIVQIKMLGEIL